MMLKTKEMRLALNLLEFATDKDLVKILATMDLDSAIVIGRPSNSRGDCVQILNDLDLLSYVDDYPCRVACCKLADQASVDKAIDVIAGHRASVEFEEDAPKVLELIKTRFRTELHQALLSAAAGRQGPDTDEYRETLLDTAKDIALLLDNDPHADPVWQDVACQYLNLVY